MRVLCSLLLALASSPAAHAADLRVLSAGAVQEAERPLAADFAERTHNPVEVVTGTVGQVRAMLEAGETADVVVVSAPVMEALVRAGIVAEGTTVPMGRIGIGVAIRKGAPHPDIATVESFRATILGARSIVYMDPAAGASSGIAMARILSELGIADELAGRTLLLTTGYTAEKVANGEAEYALQNISELIAVEDVELVGPLPPALQTYTTYVAGIASQSANRYIAANLIAHMTAESAAERWREAGIEPGAE